MSSNSNLPLIYYCSMQHLAILSQCQCAHCCAGLLSKSSQSVPKTKLLLLLWLLHPVPLMPGWGFLYKPLLTNTPISLQTFQLYGKRFGGIEPRFKDYKSGTFDILRSKIRNAQALSNLLMMIEIAELLAIRLGLIMIEARQRSKIDWHSHRGLSLLQLGIRTVKSFCHQARSIPFLTPLPWLKILPVCASVKKQSKLDRRIEFSQVISFAY